MPVSLFLMLVFASHALVLAGCKARCRPGQRMEGNSCIKISAEGAAGTDPEAKDAGSDGGSDGSTAVATGTKASPQAAAAGSSGADAAPASSSSAPQAGSGGAAGSASGVANASEQQPPADPCDTEGATRCAPAGAQGTRETCTTMAWSPSAPCAAGETCVMQDNSAECAAVEKLCVGSMGQPVCDLQGTMLLCNEDGTVRSQEMCGSAKLCRAGIAASVCAACLANEEYRCTDKALELCGDDGMTFAMQQECETAALCNATVGMCTEATCVPGAFSCANNTLKVCNADGTDFDETRSMPCGGGTCDAKGMDCNLCEPGMKTCMGDAAAVCDETGQSFEPMPCRSGLHCVGAGNCVECENHDQCPDEAKGCQEGRCQGNMCSTAPARDGKACGSSASCVDGECCTPNCMNKCGGVADGCGGTCDAACPPRCGNGVVEGNEICDGNCPTSCRDDGDACTLDVPHGLPCMIECVSTRIGTENECGGCGTLRFTGDGIPAVAQIGMYCQVGMGACFATGMTACKDRPSDEVICNARGASPTTEICNNEDDDCNGIQDDGAAETSCGEGMRCVGGGAMPPCEPIP